MSETTPNWSTSLSPSPCVTRPFVAPLVSGVGAVKLLRTFANFVVQAWRAGWASVAAWSCYQSGTASGRARSASARFRVRCPPSCTSACSVSELERLMPHGSHLLPGGATAQISTDNPSSGPSCSARSRTGWCPRSEPCSGRLDSTRLPRAERTAGRPTGRPPATWRPASKGRLGEPSSPFRACPTGEASTAGQKPPADLLGSSRRHELPFHPWPSLCHAFYGLASRWWMLPSPLGNPS